MNDIEWGDEIAVDGVRPDWLRQKDTVNVHTGAGWVAVHEGTEDSRSAPLADWAWSHSSGRPCITAIRLPATHPYYLATSRGFTYWPGGESAPEDWDGGECLFECEESWVPDTPDDSFRDIIIGYRKRTEQPAPAIAPELVERMVALMAYMATGAESILEQYHPVNTGLGMAYTEAKAINDALRPEDPDLTLAKSIVGDAEAIALAIKAARENGRG